MRTEIADQWVVAGLKMPVNGTYEVRLRLRVESIALNAVWYDDKGLLSLIVETISKVSHYFV